MVCCAACATPDNSYSEPVIVATFESLDVHRMPYKRWREDDLDIGSRAVEGAVRKLVRTARWSRNALGAS
jgi:hypothetical protein